MELQQTDTARYRRIMDLENRIQKFLNGPVLRSGSLQSTIYIPVVVHIVYKTNAENISDAQVYSQIQVLNEDYRRLNVDKTNTPSAFASLAGDANIEFVLAKTDPFGNSTTGITRTFTTQTQFYPPNYENDPNGDGVKFLVLPWNTDRYLNIWVCNLGDLSQDGGLKGYAQFPDQFYTNPFTDGVVINYQCFGREGSALDPRYNKGRTATHEIGHWLGLRHIWGDDDKEDGSCPSHDCCWGSDEVNDTPNQETRNYKCPSFPKTDACSPVSPGVMFMNYMDYSDDACMNMFTNGQIERMRAVFYAQRLTMLGYSNCYNGIQDPTETGIDCGCMCPPCDVVTPPPSSFKLDEYWIRNSIVNEPMKIEVRITNLSNANIGTNVRWELRINKYPNDFKSDYLCSDNDFIYCETGYSNVYSFNLINHY